MATCKFAVLLALIDVCLENTLPTGEAPGAVTARQHAERVVGMYWPHTTPFADHGGAAVLLQNTGGQSEIVSLIRRVRDRAGADPSAPLSRVRLAEPATFARLVR